MDGTSEEPREVISGSVILIDDGAVSSSLKSRDLLLYQTLRLNRLLLCMQTKK